MAVTVPDLVLRGILQQVRNGSNRLPTLAQCALVNWHWSLIAVELLYDEPFTDARPLLIRTLLQFVNDEEWPEVPFAHLIRPDHKNAIYEYPRFIKRLDAARFLDSIEVYLIDFPNIKPEYYANMVAVARVILATMGRYAARIYDLTMADTRNVGIDAILVEPKVLPIFVSLARLRITSYPSTTALLNGLGTVCMNVRALYVMGTPYDMHDDSLARFILRQKALKSVNLDGLGDPFWKRAAQTDALEALDSHAETLQQIEICDMILEDACFDWIPKCAKLESLTITGCSVDDNLVSALRRAELPSLEVINVTRCFNEDLSAWVRERLEANPKLRDGANDCWDGDDDDIYDELEDYLDQVADDYGDYGDYDYEDFFSDNSLDLYDLTFV